MVEQELQTLFLALLLLMQAAVVVGLTEQQEVVVQAVAVQGQGLLTEWLAQLILVVVVAAVLLVQTAVRVAQAL
jgi:hypothetical protein